MSLSEFDRLWIHDVWNHINVATQMSFEGKHEDAVHLFIHAWNTAMNGDSDDPDLFEMITLGSIYKSFFQLGDFASARPWVQRASELPINARCQKILVDLGVTHFELGEVERAFAIFDQVYANSHTLPFDHRDDKYLRFYYTERKSRLPRRSVLAKEYPFIDKKIDSLIAEAENCFAQGRFFESRTIAEKAVQLLPQPVEGWEQFAVLSGLLTRTHYKSGSYASAKDTALMWAAALDTDDIENMAMAELCLGSVAHKCLKYDAANDYFDRVFNYNRHAFDSLSESLKKFYFDRKRQKLFTIIRSDNYGKQDAQ
jgi:tetratricopeptide (TPR) repeat protein